MLLLIDPQSLCNIESFTQHKSKR